MEFLKKKKENMERWESSRVAINQNVNVMETSEISATYLT